MRKTTTTTRYPGVQRISEGRYRIRAKVTDPRTSRVKEVDREVEAPSPAVASSIRDRLRAEALVPAETRARPRLGDFAASWTESRAHELKRSTGERYANVLDKYIGPRFGAWYIDAITEQDVATWRDEMPGAPATRNSRLTILQTLLEAAVPRYIAHNPATRVKPVRVPKVDRAPNRLTLEELGPVLEKLRLEDARRRAEIDEARRARPGARSRVPVAYPMVLALVTTGARWGEVSALRWSDVDEEKRTIRIERAHYRGTVDSTKTGEVFTLPLTLELGRVLREHRRMLLEVQHPGLARDLVFPSTRAGVEGNSGLRNSSSIRKPFIAALKATELGRRQTVHGLRRTFNDLVRQVASTTVVRSMTRHRDEVMTDRYAHVGMDERAAAVNRAFRVIAGGASGDQGGDAKGASEGGTSEGS